MCRYGIRRLGVLVVTGGLSHRRIQFDEHHLDTDSSHAGLTLGRPLQALQRVFPAASCPGSALEQFAHTDVMLEGGSVATRPSMDND